MRGGWTVPAYGYGREDADGRRAVRRGIRVNIGQHALLVANVVFIGAMVGVERSVVPLLAEDTFAVTSRTLALSFIAGFGAAKAVSNGAAGWLADRFGRRRVLRAGWVVAPAVPLLLAVAPSWGWVVAANLLLGVQQGLTWTMTLAMMGDLAGTRRRGFAMGLNESAGYVAIAVATWASAELAVAIGLRAAPLWLGALAALGGVASAWTARETLEAPEGPGTVGRSVEDARAHRVGCGAAGLTTKAIDAGVWGLLPVLLAERGVAVGTIGLIAGLYPAAWGVGQLATGAVSDAVGRRLPIVAGMAGQAAGLALFVASPSTAAAAAGAATLGLGTALAYPTLLAAVQDVAGDHDRGRALGSYRFWRDSGFVVGALGMGLLADVYDIPTAIGVAAAASLLAAAAAAGVIVDPAPDAVSPRAVHARR